MRLLILFSGILVLNVGTFAAHEPSQDDQSTSPCPESEWLKQVSLDRVSNGTARFSNRLVQECAAENKKNFVVSPIGAALTMAMASFAAKTQTEMAFRNSLGLSRYENRRVIGFRETVDLLNTYTAGELHVANAVYLSKKYRPNPDYRAVLEEAFRSTIQTVDFRKSLETSNIINKWSEDKTHSRIKEIVKPNDLDASTAAVLTNAVYFKGTWLKKFNANKTVDSTFYLDHRRSKQVKTMNGLFSVRYGEYPEVDSIFIELPYKSDDSNHNMSMFVILPKKINGLAYLEENLDKISLQSLSKRGSIQEVKISLPKFKIETESQLKGPLTRMGLGIAFDPRRADFSGMFVKDSADAALPGVYIEKVIQKAFISVDEEGSEAAATTAAIFGFRSAGVPKYVSFNANHPFYAVIATTNKNPLNVFTSRFTGQE